MDQIMGILDEAQTKTSFEAKLKGLSVAYNRTVKISTKQFEAFCKKECDGKTIEKTFDYIKKLPEEKRELTLYHVFQTWINELTETLDPTTIKTKFGVIKKLARHYGIKINTEDVKENLTFPKKIKERKYVLTLDDIHVLLEGSHYKKRGFYLFLISTGMRPKEALSIRKRHVTMLNNGRYVIKIPAEATKLKIEREAFASKELLPHLTKILRSKNENDLLWTGQENSDFAVMTADAVFRSLLKRVGFTQKYEHVNRNKLNLYCFRGFFYAKASMRHGDEYAHKAIGHTGYLPQYDRKTLDEKLSMFEDYENDLITDQTLRQKGEIIQLKEKSKRIDELESIVKNQDKDFAKRVEAIYDKMLADRRKINNEDGEIHAVIEKAQKNVKAFKKQLED